MAGIDLNADVGEGGDDPPLLAVVTSASVACGGHAGDDRSMRATLRHAAHHQVTVGAHPSYRDRDGFGRRSLPVDPATLAADLDEQLGALLEAARACGVAVRFVKPHGALYADAAARAEIGAVVAAATARHGLTLLHTPGVAAEAAARLGVPVAFEAFADRAYRPDGTLVPRGEPGAVVSDPDAVAATAVAIATEGRVRAVDGSWVPLEAGSICVHGDTPGAVTLARAVRDALAGAAVRLGPFAA